jgi:hypothetical protein
LLPRLRLYTREIHDDGEVGEIRDARVREVEFRGGTDEMGPCGGPVDVVFARRIRAAEEVCRGVDVVVEWGSGAAHINAEPYVRRVRKAHARSDRAAEAVACNAVA